MSTGFWHPHKKESRLRDSPRANGSQSDIFLTASCASSRSVFYFIGKFHFHTLMYHGISYETKEVQPHKPCGCTSFYVLFYLLFYILFLLYISFISRLLIRADAPSDKPPASADLSPAHISALWKYPNVPASPAPILSPPRCRPYAPQRNVSTYAA